MADADADKNFFQKMSIRWEQVEPLLGQDGEPGSIPTKEFLAAAKELCRIFDLLNSIAFNPVKSDMERNIAGVEERYNKFPEKSATLQALVRAERAEGVSIENQSAMRCLLWYKRGMEFLMTTFMRSLADLTEELSKSFSEAYSVSLSKHHNMLMRPVFHMALKACPYRADFYKSLGGDQTSLVDDMKSYFGAYSVVTKALVAFFNAEKLEEKP